MRIFMLLLLLFPILELTVLISVGSAIGVLPTIALVIATSIFGGLVLRIAGITTAWRARERLARGEMPDQEVLQGVMMAVGGGLLLLPGFITDVIGVLCLFPGTRRLLIGRMRRRAAEQAERRRAFADDLAARNGQPGPGASKPNVLEGEYERRD